MVLISEIFYNFLGILWALIITTCIIKLVSKLPNLPLKISFLKVWERLCFEGNSMLSELVHYKHLVLSAKVITFEKNSLLAFVLHAHIHSKRIFLSACVITWVAFQRLSFISVWFLVKCALRVSILVNIYSH